jgi:hypothetical protein
LVFCLLNNVVKSGIQPYASVKTAAKSAAANVANAKKPPAALKAMFRDDSLTWDAKKGKEWMKFSAGQLSYQLELEVGLALTPGCVTGLATASGDGV